MLFARVIVDISSGSADRAFTYIVPPELIDRVRPGVPVEVPFGKSGRLVRGRVISVREETDLDIAKIKPISSVPEDAEDLSEELMKLALCMAEEYCSTLNQALKAVLPVTARVRPNSRRQDPVRAISSKYSYDESEIKLNPDQQKAVDEIMSDKRTSLLYGVTGSGKTRVYIELIRRMKAEHKETIVLIPEISLTYQTVGELVRYLGEGVAVMHSKLSAGERYEQFNKAKNGGIDVIVGPRSALFTPFKRLGLIIIDEEHERTYHSDTAPQYDAAWVAGKRAELNGAKLVLSSATPSLKSYKKALQGTYSLHTLLERPVSKSTLPNVSIVDMRTEIMRGNRSIFSGLLKEKIDETLKRDEQVMLFLNRRGYSRFVSCRSCGEALKCPRCDVTLTVHNSWFKDPATGLRSALLSCHYCGFTRGMPDTCPVCKSRHLARFGVGTEQLEQAVKKDFPLARVLRMDADTTQKKGSYEAILSAMRQRKADILIGTQMIVKGHDFPFVTLVGIVAADLELNTPEYDAAERTFELLTQAAGRSGRGERPGEVIIQSYVPDHYAIECAARQDFPGFYERELSYRKLLCYPPETAMLFLRLRSADEALLTKAAQFAGDFIDSMKEEGLIRFGPVNESIYKIKDSYRKIIYVKHPEHDIIKKVLKAALGALREEFPQRNLFISSEIR